MMDYCVVSDGNLDELQKSVVELLAKGWRPLGGISVTCYHFKDRDGWWDYSMHYLQAMVKEDERIEYYDPLEKETEECHRDGGNWSDNA